MALPIEYRKPVSQDREAAIRQYAPLVKYVVGRLAIGLPAILDYEDILSYGTIGLIEALDRFDDSKGVKFETYAISRIRGSIIDALRSLDRLPRSVRQKAKRLGGSRHPQEQTINRLDLHAVLFTGEVRAAPPGFGCSP